MLTREEAKKAPCPFISRCVPLLERIICYHSTRLQSETQSCFAEECPLWADSNKYPITEQTCPYSKSCLDKTKCDTCIHRYGYCRG